MPDPCIETEELVLVECCRHGASAVDHLAEATAVAKETEPNLRIGKCSQGIKQRLCCFHFLSSVLLAVGRGPYGGAKEVEVVPQDSRPVGFRVSEQSRGEELVEVRALRVGQNDEFTLRGFQGEAKGRARGKQSSQGF